MKNTAPHSPHPLLLTRNPDSTQIRIAFLFALSAHLTILMLPWQREPAVLTVPIKPSPIDIVDWEPKIPEARPPEVVVQQLEPRRIPVPMDEIEPESVAPLREVAPIESDLEVGDEVEAILGDAPPPPEPYVVDQGAAGLEPPVRMAGAADPEYPRLAVEARITGQVILRAVIDRFGEVTEVEILRSPSPDVGLTRAAIDAVALWRYSPGMLNGRAVAVRMTVVVNFSLN